MHRIYKAEQTTDFKISVTFFNGEVREYDLEGYSNDESMEKRLETYARLLSEIRIDNSRNGLRLSDDTHISNSELYYGGVKTKTIHIDDLNVQFADTFQSIRERSGLTQKDVAERSGIQQADISKIEKGESNPSLHTVYRLARAVNYSVTLNYEHLKENRTFPELMLSEELVPYLGVLKKQGEFTVEDMKKLPEDVIYELINGYIYDIGVPSMLHQDILGFIFFEIYNFIKSNNGKCKVSSNFGLEFENDEKNYVVPDIGIVCDQDKVSYEGVKGAPDFIVEIVSPYNKRNDYNRKLDLYRERGVREYWILDPDKRSLTVYSFEESEFPKVHFFNEKVYVGIYGDKLCIDLKEIDAMIDSYNGKKQPEED